MRIVRRMVSLAPDDLVSLRASVERHAARMRARRDVVTIAYEGGPLDGMRDLTERANVRMRFVGWCVVTRTGPVTAMYEACEDRAVWRFCQLEGGPQW